MKKTTFKETDATYEDKLAMIMAVGDATIEEASRALAECNGDVDGAMTIVYDQAPPPSNDYASSSSSSSLHNAPYKPTRKARHSEDVNDESIAKPSESLRHAPTLVARRRPVIAAAAAAASPKGPKENVFHAQHQPTTTSPSIASANQNAGTVNQTMTNPIPSRDSLLNAPGAFAIGGVNDVVCGHDDDNFTYTQQNVSVVDNAHTTNLTNPVEARLVDNADDVENLQEQLQRQREALRQREEELEHMQRQQENVVVGQVLGAGTNDADEGKAQDTDSNKEDLSVSSNNKSICGLKRKVTIAVLAVLVIVAVVVGIIVATSKNSDATSKNSDENSLAKKLASIYQNTTYLDLYSNSLTGTIPSQITMLSNLNYLDLSHNSLTGTIPSEVGLLTKLTWLSLWDNSLTGPVPSQIALISNLNTLWLTGNSLMGTIPNEIGLLTKLTWLDLYSNDFTGEFTCPRFIDYCWISCDYYLDTYTQACRSL